MALYTREVVSANQAMTRLLRYDTSREEYVRGHHPDHHAGRIVPTGVALVLATLPPLQSSDNFVDIGSGIGNVEVQIALES
ncbi:Histone methylation protein DOT1 [Phytophthora infestans]|uniref:Histone methylation protein DOT1 n=1 Tax=Phytophthora infestans TaxID=4787 RepID=A0A8S9UU32_PHYIN|nr:Histone methylation protein DOT1 [Phytophthora infestans]